jgi:hypothetical protein
MARRDFSMRAYLRLGATWMAASLLAACGGGDTQPPTYAVGGSLAGLSGSGLTLQLNGAQDLVLTRDGT